MKNKPKRGGFGLVEVMISLVVAMIAFCGAYAMCIQALRITRIARDESKSIQAAQYEIEKLRTYSWRQVLALGSAYTVTVGQVSGNTALNNLAGGSAIIRTATFAMSTNRQVLTVTAEVTWIDKEANKCTNTITTLIARRGLLQ